MKKNIVKSKEKKPVQEKATIRKPTQNPTVEPPAVVPPAVVPPVVVMESRSGTDRRGRNVRFRLGGPLERPRLVVAQIPGGCSHSAGHHEWRV